jgi:hypothetical protein
VNVTSAAGLASQPIRPFSLLLRIGVRTNVRLGSAQKMLTGGCTRAVRRDDVSNHRGEFVDFSHIASYKVATREEDTNRRTRLHGHLCMGVRRSAASDRATFSCFFKRISFVYCRLLIALCADTLVALYFGLKETKRGGYRVGLRGYSPSRAIGGLQASN